VTLLIADFRLLIDPAAVNSSAIGNQKLKIENVKGRV
jgi:hypothetical protein